MRKFIPNPPVRYSERTVSGFLWLPKFLPNWKLHGEEIRWLEHATWIEQFIYTWRPHRWTDTPTPPQPETQA